MLKKLFREKVRTTFPNDKDKNIWEALIRFIQEDLDEENVNSQIEYGILSRTKRSVFMSIIQAMPYHTDNDRTAIENIIDALLAKKLKIDENDFYNACTTSLPTLTDVILKKFHPIEKEKLFAKMIFDAKIIPMLFWLYPEKIRILINNGFPVEKLRYNLKNFEFHKTIMPEFATPTDLDSKEYLELYHSELIKIRSEIIRRMTLTLEFPSSIDLENAFLHDPSQKFSTLGDFSFVRDGISYDDMLRHLQAAFKNYSSMPENVIENKTLKEFFPELNERKLILQESSEIILTSGMKEQGNRIIPLSTLRTPQEQLHAEGLLIFDDLVMKVNRGERKKYQQSGITVFQKSSATIEQTANEYFLQLQEQSVLKGDDFDFDIGKMVNNVPLITLPMREQKIGNCSWASSKAFVLATFFAVIRKQLKIKNPAESEHLINTKAASIAKSIYKEFTTLHRTQEIENYISIHAKDSFKLADEMILIPMIAQAFKIKGKVLEQIKDSRELCNLIEKEPKKFLQHAVKNDDVDFIRFILNINNTALNQKLINELLSLAIKRHAINTISHFETLFNCGPLTNLRLSSCNPLMYSLSPAYNPEAEANTIIALIKYYHPIPYEDIMTELRTTSFSRFSDYAKEARLDFINTIQEFCCKQLIEESKSEATKILEKQTDPKIKISELTDLQDKQTAILSYLLQGLAKPIAESHERIFKASMDAAIQFANTDNPTKLVHTKQPDSVKSLAMDSQEIDPHKPKK